MGTGMLKNTQGLPVQFNRCKISTLEGELCSTEAVLEGFGILGGSMEESDEEESDERGDAMGPSSPMGLSSREDSGDD
jgi:hypothetical protein